MREKILNLTGWTNRNERTSILVFFFLSGIPALVYQLLWQRTLFRIFGTNIESTTIVVTVFMIGLGLGSLAGSWLSTRRSMSPLLLLSVMEACVGLFGFFALRFYDWAGHLTYGLSLFERAGFAIGLLIVPTVLMGATLPLLVEHTLSRSGGDGLSAAKLYQVNTLGAAAGCCLCIFVFFPFLGMQGTASAAVSINLVAAIVAFFAYRIDLKRRPDNRSVASLPDSFGPLRVSYRLAIILAFLGGYVSLSNEIFYIHVVSYATGTSPFSMGIVLAVFLVGIASGAREAAGWSIEQGGKVPLQLYKMLILAGVLGFLLLPGMTLFAFLGNAAVAPVLVICFFTSRALGAVFPLVADHAAIAALNPGWRVGLVYMANILGSALGSILTGFVLFDVIGLRIMVVVLSFCTLGMAIVIGVGTGSTGRPGVRNVLSLGAVCALLLAVVHPSVTHDFFSHLQYKQDSNKFPPLATVIENRSGIIGVSPLGTVFGGGLYDGAFNTDLVRDINFIVRPYSLSLFQAAPRDVLFIGLSSGSWVQVVVNNPYVRHVAVVEINGGYREIVAQNKMVSSLLANKNVEIITDDGRRWLSAHPEAKFDAIIANTSYNFRSNATNVLSQEFDQIIKAHLNPNGIYFFNTTESTRLMRTACEVFAHGYRIFNNMIVSDDELDLNISRWSDVLKNYRIDDRKVLDLTLKEDQATFDGLVSMPSDIDNSNLSSASKRIESCNSVRQRTLGEQIVTDDNMGTEWRAPLRLDKQDSPQ
jgi:spermidine synthase